MRTTTVLSLTIICALGLAASANAIPSITAYISAPDAQFAPTFFTNLSVETFDALPLGNDTDGYTSPIGTYSGGAFIILADDQYGNGTDNYFAFGNRNNSATPVNLTFSTPVSYFGIAYQAGDNNNGITFYDNNDAFLGRFSTATLLSFFNNSGGTVTATDNSTYTTSSYFGKPNNGANGQEPSTYLNFVVTNGSIGRVLFDNSGNTSGTGFESDNHTISTTQQNPNGTPLVFVENVAVVPEAGTLVFLAFAGIPALGAAVTRRRK